MHILVTDDSKLARTFIKRELKACFETEKLEILEASSGKQAINLLLENEQVELLFLDLTMPEMDGYQVLEALQPMNLDVKKIVVSADIQNLAKQRVMELGAVGFIEKPIPEGSLRSTLIELGVLS